MMVVYEATLSGEDGSTLSVVTMVATDLLDALAKIYEPVGEECLRRPKTVSLTIAPRDVRLQRAASPRAGKVVGSSPPDADAEDWERLFEDAMAGASGGFLEMLEDVYSKWQGGARLSPRQAEVVRAAAERYAERHPGGRVR